MVQLLQDLSEEGNAMTNAQDLRKKISRSCINALEERVNKSRIGPEDTKSIIVSEVDKVVSAEY